MRVAIAVLLVAAGCAPRMVGTKTSTRKTSEVINVEPDTSPNAAWVTFRNTTTVTEYAVMASPIDTATKTLQAVDTGKVTKDVVWFCDRVEGNATPHCVRAVFDGIRPLPQPAPAQHD